MLTSLIILLLMILIMAIFTCIYNLQTSIALLEIFCAFLTTKRKNRFVYIVNRQPAVEQITWTVFYPEKYDVEQLFFIKENHFLSWLTQGIFSEPQSISL